MSVPECSNFFSKKHKSVLGQLVNLRVIWREGLLHCS